MSEDNKVVITVTLKSPIGVNGEKVSELTFKEATLHDLIMAEKRSEDGVTAYMSALLASMAKVPFDDFIQITPKDWQQIMEQTRTIRGNEPAADMAAS